MTKTQRDILLEYGHRGIAVDSTHNTTMYLFKLTTVLVYDNFGCGRIVAFYLSKEESAADLDALFQHLSTRFVYHISIQSNSYFRCAFTGGRIFMSDDSPAFWNAYCKYFNTTNTKHLLCSWHVMKNWKKHVMSTIALEHRPTITVNLYALMRYRVFFDLRTRVHY